MVLTFIAAGVIAPRFPPLLPEKSFTLGLGGHCYTPTGEPLAGTCLRPSTTCRFGGRQTRAMNHPRLTRRDGPGRQLTIDTARTATPARKSAELVCLW